MKDRKAYHKEWHKKNKTKQRVLNSAWAKANPRKHKSIAIKYRFGISIEEYEALFDAQDGRCAICSKIMELGKYAHLDHDHNSKELRGFLCNKCNTGLGMFQDSKQLLKLAIQYLERGKS